MSDKALFTEEMKMADALKAHSDTIKVFKKFGIGCNTCSGRDQDSIKAGAVNHGIDPAELLKELNKLKK